ncbi:MAG: glycoside hydrolase family 88 protein [Alicyclobacillus macrosporangiidus]|uniref:glycoside hydrolase family 88/105 protein n=1 Tax=Alicyclobacillus macrosporangiidus TaxID=392015 RepID=UPI0026F185D0|nr:glycoside hydrolase family 88 protein [Alicyclobacillus macrosporangiidus]MCL6597197.1 glycoside hydrolase family 88 protein [Alicyclobacillus macrosporangiidus]
MNREATGVLRMADACAQRAFAWSDGLHASWNYESGCVLRAVREIGRRTGRTEYLAFVREVVDGLVDADGRIRTYVLEEYNLDQINEGKLLFRLYAETGDARYRRAAERLRMQLEGQPRTQAGGFWHKKIYPYQMWLDGGYMAAPFLAEYAYTFARPAWFDTAAEHLLLLEQVTRDPNTGLLYHGWDETREQRWANPATGRSPEFWGRAIGWFAMAVVDVLDFLPVNHPRRGQLVGVFERLMHAVAAVQDEATGLWYQVLDKAGHPGNYLESSCSAMFAYALAKGVRRGYLSRGFSGVAERAFDGLVAHHLRLDGDGRPHLMHCNAVAGLGGKPYRDGSYAYYVGERVVEDEPKAVAAFLLAGLEVALGGGIDPEPVAFSEEDGRTLVRWEG